MTRTFLLMVICCGAVFVEGNVRRKRNAAAIAGVAEAAKGMNPAAAAEAAAKLATAVSDLAKTTSGILTSGAGKIAMVRWLGNLNYQYKEAHGKAIMKGSDEHGGTIAVTKRDSALIGAEANVIFTDPSTGQKVGEVYLATWYGGSQPNAVLVSGFKNFVQQTNTDTGNTVIVLGYIPPSAAAANYAIADYQDESISMDSSSSEIYPLIGASSSTTYDAASSTIVTKPTSSVSLVPVTQLTGAADYEYYTF